MDMVQILCGEFKLSAAHVTNIIELIDEGNTIPFIARYRKELTGACDDQVLRELHERLTYLRNLQKRREDVLQSIEEQGKLTDEIAAALEAAKTLAEVEDIYRPFKPKRKTRATMAIAKGLEPLALHIFAQDATEDITAFAESFIDEEKGVATLEDALSGAKDIIAEWISDDSAHRKSLRQAFLRDAVVSSKGVKTEDSVYTLYYDFTQPVRTIVSHRILAINRGEKEGFLKVALTLSAGIAESLVTSTFVKQNSFTSSLVQEAALDGLTRLLLPSMEREIRGMLSERAEEQAIKMFGLNLQPLLMQPPLKGKVVLGFDPAYRTGCKISVVDDTGKVLDHTVIYPTPPQSKVAEAKAVIKNLVKKHKVSVVAVGNGTASKESEIFIAEVIKECDGAFSYAMVNEAGASVYSASKLGADEFPDLDVTIRSSISIARRLQDPLAELVKIDPKSVGVGQYQHDMPQNKLSETLTGVVENCVNGVGVDLNTASESLLTYVAGVGSSLAKNIVLYREENGAFRSRTELKKVAKLGPKAYLQAAGFLRIPGGKNVLDCTGVHPESYAATEKLLSLFALSAKDVAAGKAAGLREQVEAYGVKKAAEQCGLGDITLLDILAELEKPGRDIREDLPQPILRSDIMDMSDLKEGMELTGTVRNVVDFGVFVDIGVHQDGLVHISRVCNRFIRHPSEVVQVGDIVQVWVLGVEKAKNRISLSMMKPV